MTLKILKLRTLVSEWSGWKDVLVNEEVSIRKIYYKIYGQQPKVQWCSLITKCLASPKARFIVWFACNKRIATKDRLIAWGLNLDPLCVLCGLESESHDHIFCKCGWSKELKGMVMGVFDTARVRGLGY